MKKLRAILIDPKEKTIKEVEFQYENFKSFYPVLDCETITVPVILEGEDQLVVDDEGRLHMDRELYAFNFNIDPKKLIDNLPKEVIDLKGNYIRDIAGKAMIIGADEEGDITDAKTSLDEIKKRVEWVGDITNKPIPDPVVLTGQDALDAYFGR